MIVGTKHDLLGNDLSGVGEEPKDSLKGNHTGSFCSFFFRGHSISHSLPMEPAKRDEEVNEASAKPRGAPKRSAGRGRRPGGLVLGAQWPGYRSANTVDGCEIRFAPRGNRFSGDTTIRGVCLNP